MLGYVLFNDSVYSYTACVDISYFLNPLSPVSDQERISPYNIKHRSDENKEKYQLEDYYLILYQILQIDIIRIVWQTVGRIANEIFGVKGLIANR